MARDRGCVYTRTGQCDPLCLGRGCRNKRSTPHDDRGKSDKQASHDKPEKTGNQKRGSGKNA